MDYYDQKSWTTFPNDEILDTTKKNIVALFLTLKFSKISLLNNLFIIFFLVFFLVFLQIHSPKRMNLLAGNLTYLWGNHNFSYR